MGAEALIPDLISQETIDFLASPTMLVVEALTIGIVAMAIKGGRRKGSGKEQRKPSKKKGWSHRPPSQRPSGHTKPASEGAN